MVRLWISFVVDPLFFPTEWGVLHRECWTVDGVFFDKESFETMSFAMEEESESELERAETELFLSMQACLAAFLKERKVDFPAFCRARGMPEMASLLIEMHEAFLKTLYGVVDR